MTEPGEATLRSLVSQLIAQQSEGRNLDYKGPMTFGPVKASKGELVKCLMAFANTRDGGYVIVGIEQVGGTFLVRGVTDAMAATFDPTEIGNFARRHCSELPDYTVQSVDLSGQKLVLLTIREFLREPIVCTNDLHDSQGKFVLRAGTVYIRTTDAKCEAIQTATDMQAVLDLALQKRGDRLLSQIAQLMGTELPEPRSDEDPPIVYDAAIQATQSIFARESQLDEPYWEVTICPTDYSRRRVDLNALEEVRRKAEVAIRGWDFPHVDRQNDTRFEEGLQSTTHSSRHSEAHRFYRSGLFVWRSRLWEDAQADTRGTVSFGSAIYSITEFMLFASRAMSLLPDTEDVYVRVELAGLSGRSLWAEAEIRIWEDYRTQASRFVWAQRISVATLRAEHLDLAQQACFELLQIFGLTLQMSVIDYWQNRFVNRQF